VTAGLGHQSKVAVYLRNGPEYLETVFAAFKAGLIPINVNYRYGVAELLHLFNDADIEAVVFDSSFDSVVRELRDGLPAITFWCRVGQGDGIDAVPYQSAVSYRGPTELNRTDGDDLVMIYTGGTTGMPKGVMWRQADLVPLLARKRERTVGTSPLGPSDDQPANAVAQSHQICLIACPLMHGTGLFMALATLIGDGTVVTLTGAKFDPYQLLRTVAANRVTSIILVGDAFARPILRALDVALGESDISSVRSIVSAGAMWSHDVKAGLLEHNPTMTLVDSFGASEVSGLGESISTGETIKGTATFNLSEHAHLVDEAGAVIPPESPKPGLVVVGGPLPVGYYKDPKKTASTFQTIGGQRYAITGDWAHYTDGGSLVFLGRGSGCINSGGEKIFPEEVEEVIKLLQGVADAAVLGVPDKQFGQKLVSLVQSEEGVTLSLLEITAHVQVNLAGYKVPRHVWFVPSLERTPSGKLDYERLRKMVDELHGAHPGGSA
jgi:fatty-acyl-CoA synthase